MNKHYLSVMLFCLILLLSNTTLALTNELSFVSDFTQSTEVSMNSRNSEQVAFRVFRAAAGGYRGFSYGSKIGSRLRRAPPSLAVRPSSGSRVAPKVQQAKDFTRELQYTSRNQFQKKFSQLIKNGRTGNLQAHHIVPWELRSHPIVKRAAKGGFNINGRHNGVALSTMAHRGSHATYTARVKGTLDGVWEKTKHKNVYDWQYAQLLINLNRKERKTLLNLDSRLG
ncbi:MAG: AHH domain-containing protein [Candidatus Thiodiazotropha sp. (ex Troendleina suluensis)]|nr:AHH domain-containing protein [Candidatus Thiodiazotropha sp. (ex Troendleina suluensis)]